MGNSDGTYNGLHYFDCERGQGIFVPLNRLSTHDITAEYKERQADAVDVDATLSSNSQTQAQPSILASSGDKPFYDFHVSSRVQFPCSDYYNFPYKHGIIMWIGFLPKVEVEVAGIELVCILQYLLLFSA